MKPLPGRVAVRLVDVDRMSSVLTLPGLSEASLRAQTSHRGVVVAMGDPARTPKRGTPVPPGFSVGAEVVFVFASSRSKYDWGTGKQYDSGLVESARRGTWGDVDILWISQEEVLAVVTP